jgi:hypothetical protein
VRADTPEEARLLDQVTAIRQQVFDLIVALSGRGLPPEGAPGDVPLRLQTAANSLGAAQRALAERPSNSQSAHKIALEHPSQPAAGAGDRLEGGTMQRPIAVAAAAGALAVGGTAVATPGGGPLGGLLGEHDERKAELARDLASKLDGVSAGEVERALDEVHEERRAEHRKQLAQGLASKLEGVSAEEAERALRKSHEELRHAFERGGPPRGEPVATLAQELGKAESEVRRALRAIRRDRLEGELEEAVREGRISEEQAERIRERFERGSRFRRIPLHHPAFGGPRD